MREPRSFNTQSMNTTMHILYYTFVFLKLFNLIKKSTVFLRQVADKELQRMETTVGEPTKDSKVGPFALEKIYNHDI